MDSMIALDPTQAEATLIADDIKKRNVVLSSISAKQNEIKIYQNELIPLAQSLKDKRRSLTISKAIYFELGTGESKITKIKYDALLLKLKDLKLYQVINDSDEKVIEKDKPAGWTDEKWNAFKDRDS